jgi:hypothetical protein
LRLVSSSRLGQIAVLRRHTCNWRNRNKSLNTLLKDARHPKTQMGVRESHGASHVSKRGVREEGMKLQGYNLPDYLK